MAFVPTPNTHDDPAAFHAKARRSILTVWGLANLVMLSVALLFSYHSHQHFEKTANDLADNLLQGLEKSILARLERSRMSQQVLANALQHHSVNGVVEFEVIKEIATYFNRLPDPFRPRITNASGQLLLDEGVHAADKPNYANQAYFMQLKADPSSRFTLSEKVISEELKGPAIILAGAYTHDKGTFAGAILEELPLTSFDNLLSSASLSLHADDAIVLHDTRNFSLLARNPSLSGLNNGPPAAFIQAFDLGAMSGRFESPSHQTEGSSAQMVTYKILPDTPFVLMVGIGVHSHFAPWRELVALLFTLCAGFASLSGWTAFKLLRQESLLPHSDAHLETLNASLEAQVEARTADLTEALEAQVEARTDDLAEALERTADLAEALERIRLGRDELEGAERLASLGKIVADVAHELNTPIGNALLCASSMLEDAEALEKSVSGSGQAPLKRSAYIAALSKMRQQAEVQTISLGHAATLVSAFKQVAVDQASERRRSFELRELVDSVVTSFRPTLARSATVIDVVVDIDPLIICDTFPGAVVQITSNMLQNAMRHAFDGRETGVLTIRASTESVGDDEFTPSQWIHIEYSDNGAGLPPGGEERVFDPFFTTKASTGGSGIGLSLSRKLAISALGGTLTSRSPPQGGATFLLSFPARLN